MILHLIQDAPSQNAALSCCLRYANTGDTLLFTGDSITALLQPQWQQAVGTHKCLLIADEVIAQGLGEQLKQYPQISQQEFVQQILLHSKVISW